MGFIGIYWGLLGFIGIYWDLLGFIGVLIGMFFHDCNPSKKMTVLMIIMNKHE